LYIIKAGCRPTVNKKNRCLAADLSCAPTKYRKPCGGFDNHIKAAVFLKKSKYGGCIKRTHF